MLTIDKENCIGCGACAAACPFGAMSMDEDGYPEVSEACVYCGNCKDACPVSAITIPEVGKAADLDDYQDIWVFMERSARRNQLQKASLELLSEARVLADKTGQKVGAILLCSQMPDGFSTAIASVGCDYARIIEDVACENYSTDIFSGIVTKLAETYKPYAILFPATENGRDLAPRVSCALQTGLTADCTGLDIDSDGNLIQIRPTYGGNIIASIISPNHRPQLASVRPNVFAVRPAKPQGNLTLYKESIEPEHLEDRVRLVKSEEKEDAYRDVTEADILIVGGYGVGSKENFQKLEKLAIRMNAAIGATRKAVDEGWAPADVQVGQTGKTVAPSLYIGCGVSGALQHTIGMKNAKTIITINNNPAAPIFAMSDVAILGDCVEVCEALCERIEAIRR